MKHPRALRRSFHIKVMSVGVVAQPLPELGSGREMFLKDISDKEVWKKTSYNQNFSDNVVLNSELMAEIGGWRERVTYNTLTFSGISEQLANYCDLENFVSGRLMFTYESYGEIRGDKKSNF